MKAVKMTKKDMYEPHSHKDLGIIKEKSFSQSRQSLTTMGKTLLKEENPWNNRLRTNRLVHEHP